MADRTYASWVEPIAAELCEGRREIVAAAQSMPDEAWTKASPLEGWSYKDLLAHLAGGDWMCQKGLRAVVANEWLDTSASAIADYEGRNERFRREREGHSIEELVAEVEAEGEETQELLARLTEADEEARQEDIPISEGDYLRAFPDHDQRHLKELRTALEGFDG